MGIGKCFLVQRTQADKVKFIEFVLDRDTLKRIWGLVGGRTQETSHTYDYINEGKLNELTPELAAEADFDRRKTKKIKEGYTEVASLDDLGILEEASQLDEIDFENPPTSFAPSKPIQYTAVTDEKLDSLMREGRLIPAYKENGMCHFIFIGPEPHDRPSSEEMSVKIFTRRMDNHTAKYPAIVMHVRDLIEAGLLLPRTVLAVEFLVEHENHLLGFKRMSKISKSNTNKGTLKPDQSKALALQKETPVRGCVFALLYYRGDETWRMPPVEMIEELATMFPPWEDDTVLFAQKTFEFRTLDEVDAYLREHPTQIEGFVLWIEDQPIEVGFTGKPKRRAAFKRKVIKECDVVAYGYEEGTGDHQGKIGSLLIGKYREDGTFVELGKVGSGLKDDEVEIDDWDFPVAIEIQFDNQFPDTGAFQFPRFSKIHEDKAAEDCLVDPETGF